MRYIRFFGIDRSRSAARAASINLAEIMNPAGPSERWVLMQLAVDPSVHTKGTGSMLVQWGLSKARSENVPVTLTCGEHVRKFYQKNGFQKDIKVTPESVEQKIGESGWQMIWYPKSGN
jgi:GNAT superfamily N-acetyltransferase